MIKKTTAQKETQGNKIMGVFTEKTIERFTKGEKLPAATVIDYLKRAEGVIDRLKCSDDTKSFLKSGYGLFGSLLDDREHYEWTAYEFYPQTLDGVDLDDPSTYPTGYEDADDIVDAYLSEIIKLEDELWEMLKNNEDGFYNDDIQEYLDIYEDYIIYAQDIYDRRELNDIREERGRIEEELWRQGLEGRY